MFVSMCKFVVALLLLIHFLLGPTIRTLFRLAVVRQVNFMQVVPEAKSQNKGKIIHRDRDICSPCFSVTCLPTL